MHERLNYNMKGSMKKKIKGNVIHELYDVSLKQKKKKQSLKPPIKSTKIKSS